MPLTEPFLIKIKSYNYHSASITSIVGYIEHGSIINGDKAEIVGLEGKRKVAIIEIKQNEKRVAQASCYNNPLVNILIQGIEANELKPDLMLVKRGCLKSKIKVLAEIIILTSNEGGKNIEITSNSQIIFLIKKLKQQ